MKPEDQDDFRSDGLSDERLAHFLAADNAARARERRREWSLRDYLRFLRSLQNLLGPFPINDEPWPGNDHRL